MGPPSSTKTLAPAAPAPACHRTAPFVPESTSPRRFPVTPLWRSLRVAVTVVFVSVVAITALTRTEVGRQAVRDQVEAAFNQRFQGRLSIGALRGTLLGTIVADDVEISGPSGTSVATIDSVRAVPQWFPLLTAEVAARRLTLYGPHLRLQRDSSGVWSAPRAFQPTAPSAPNELRPRFNLAVANVRVEGGAVTTRRRGRAPPIVEDGWLFDYTRMQVRQLSLRASVRRTGAAGTLVVDTASFSLPGLSPDPVRLRGRAQQTSSGGWALSNTALSLGTTRVEGRVALQGPAADTSAPAVSMQLAPSRIDLDALRALVPRLPVQKVVTVDGLLEGTLRQLETSGLTVQHAASSATLAGRLERTPEAFAMDLTLQQSSVRLRDVRAVWPNLPERLSRFWPRSPSGRGEAAEVRGTLRGRLARVRPPPTSAGTDLTATLDVQSPHGGVRGSLRVARNPGNAGDDTALQYRVALYPDRLTLAPLLDTPTLTSTLTGRVVAEGRGTALGDATGTLRLDLRSSVVAGRPLAAATGRVAVNGRRVEGRLSVTQPGGGRAVVAGTAAQVGTARPRYNARATSTNLDLSGLAAALPTTALNGQIVMRDIGPGAAQVPSRGTIAVDVDSSTLQRADSTVALPPHTVTARLTRPAPERSSGRRSRLTITGSVGRLTLDAPQPESALWAAARSWAQGLHRAYRRERHKPAPGSPVPSLSPPPPSQDASPPGLEGLQPSPAASPIHATATLQLHRPDIVHAWWGAFPKRARALTARARLALTPDSIRLSGKISADSLQHDSPQRFRGRSVRLTYEVASHLGTPLPRGTRATVRSTAEQIIQRGTALRRPSVSLRLHRRTGTLRLTADRIGVIDSLRLASQVRISPQSNELRIQHASFALDDATWTTAAPASLHAYADRLVVGKLRIQRPHPQMPSLQRVDVSGALSAAPTDTLTINAQNVYLPPLSQSLSLPNVVGGSMNATVELRSALQQPRLSTTLTVRRLSYDRRVLGNMRLQGTYAAESSTLAVRGRLQAPAQRTGPLPGPALMPGPVRSIEPNQFSFRGTVHLPTALAPSSSRPDALDLSVDIERADLFFFRYIFEERVSQVRGFTAGRLHIGGHLRDPVFDADLQIVDGGVTLPLFGLQYQAEGPVQVDRRGIHIDRLVVEDDDGRGTVEGSILFNNYQYFSFDLAAQLEGLTVINVSQARDLPFYGTIRGSGPLRLTGPLSDATLRSTAARTTPDSELFIPVTAEAAQEESGFIVFADSTSPAVSGARVNRRQNILADRPEGVPSFVDGLNLDLNVTAPEASTVHLVFDPVVGDVVTVVGRGRIQMQRTEGNFSVYGRFRATSGTYLFTAGEVFVRRFSIAAGTITWDGDPTNARLDLDAEYRTRATPSGLPGFQDTQGRIPVTVLLDITGRVATPRVDLGLSLTRSEQRDLVGSESLDAILNQPARTTEYATSVLLTNTFLLTTESISAPNGSSPDASDNRLATAGNQLAFNSVSQLVSSQLNRYLGKALPNVDLNFSLQGETPDDLDLIYGVALRLLNERLIIRGEGIYTNDDTQTRPVEGPRGEVVVEVRLSPSVSAKVFYRRDGDDLTRNRSLTSSRGVGVSYQTRFSSWRSLLQGLRGTADSARGDSARGTADSTEAALEETSENAPEEDAPDEDRPENQAPDDNPDGLQNE